MHDRIILEATHQRMNIHTRAGFVPHLYNPRECCHWCGYVVGVPVQKASQCAHEVRCGEGRRQGEERWHVSFVGDAKGRGASCIHAQAELHVDVSSSFFPSVSLPLLFSPFLSFIWHNWAIWGLHMLPTQQCTGSPVKGKETSLQLSWASSYILQHLAVTHSLTGSHYYYSFQCKQCQLTLIASVHHTHQKHQHNDSRQLEVLHTHGSCQVTTRGLKCDRLNAVQRGGF